MKSDELLPLNPDIALACQLVESEANEAFWHPVLTLICQRHNLPLTTFEKINGWANAIFVLNDQLIVKIVPPNWSIQGSREIAALSLLKHHPLCVSIPDLLASGEINGWVYLLMTQLPGTNLHDIWTTLSESEQCQIIGQVGVFARQLNQIPVEAVGDLAVDWPSFIAKQQQNCYAKRQSQGLSGPLLADLLPFIAQAKYSLPNTKACLIHSDLHAGNLLVEQVEGQWRLTGVIDFGDALIAAETQYELISSLILMGLGNPVVNQAFMAQYPLTVIDVADWQRQLMVLSLLRHSGEMGYLLQQVPGCAELTEWQSVCERFFAL